MKLYYKAGSCSLAVRIAIHAMGLPCEFEAVNLQTKQTEKGTDFWAISAKGSVPCIQLDNGEVLTENAVILQFLADAHHATTLLPAPAQFARYRVLEWLNFISTDLHKNCTPFFIPNMPKEVCETVFKPILLKKLMFIEQHLSSHSFLVGDHVTLADLYLFVVLTWMPHLQLSLEKNTARYFSEMKKLPFIQKSLKEENLQAVLA